MRVLYYNWVDYLDDEARGGGVSVYQRNLLAALDRHSGIEAAFLSSGLSFDLVSRGARWQQVRHGPDADRSRRYEIVNSGVLSPSHHSFGNPAQLSHATTRDVFFDFIGRTGPYDVIHFNNLEGLPAEVLDIGAQSSGPRVVLTLHNYYPLCPQVNLWHQERIACTEFQDGAGCVSCLPHKFDERLIRVANGIAYHLKCAGIRPGTRVFDLLFRQAMRVGSRGARGWAALRRRTGAGKRAGPEPAVAQGFAARRAGMVARINASCDHVLCVSDRVREIAEAHGIRPGILRTSYIGTRAAEKFAKTRPASRFPKQKQSLTLGFLGYMRRDKGFHFLLTALETLPADLAARLRLVVAARRGDAETMTRLEALRARLGGLTHVDGYSHDGLDDLLRDVDVGLVPVLWEDNLPQVAIEMHARHIPLLTSDMGGGRELGRYPQMVFAAGDPSSFAERIRALLTGGVDMAEYWRNARPPQRMDAHVSELLRLYGDRTGKPARTAAL